MIVVLDAGHGLPDPGAVGYVKEYEVVLDLVKRIKPVLEQHGVKVVLTRTTENAVVQPKNADVNKRVSIANSVDAALVVSVHMNAGGGHRFETYCHSKDARVQKIHDEIMKFLCQHGITDGRICLSNEGQHSSIAILDRTKAKSVLLECLFVDHPDGKLFLNPDFCQQFAEAVARGILAAVGIAYVPVKQTIIQEKKPKMKQADAEKVIAYLQVAWKAAKSVDEQKEIGRLADEVRVAAGMKKVNG